MTPAARDAADPLAVFRARFAIPDGLTYLDGNSLGALPAATPARVAAVVAGEWGGGLVASWNDAGWVDAALRVGRLIAGIVGAQADEVVVADSTSVNLFKLILAGIEAAPGRRVVLAETGNFPTDLHVARRAAAVVGRTLRAVAADALADAIDEEVAVVVLPHVHYRTGARRDMAALNARARAAGTRIVWDLSHSAGAVPLDLAADGAELAVGCGYKFLNGGPGAPAWLYVARDLQPRLHSPIAGWFGHAEPFAFGDDYAPAPGIARFQAGTPSIVALAALEVGVALMAEADGSALWRKACALFDLFADRAAARCPALELVTPRDPDRRGSQIAFRHDHAFAIVQAAIADGVVGDYREPGIARFGLTPLYTRFADIERAVDVLGAILDEGRHLDPRFATRAAVT